MDQNMTTSLTLTKAESQVMRSILVPLHPIMEEATPNQTPTEDDLFFNVALPLLTHLHTSLTEIVTMASLWRQIQKTIRLECVTDGQWHWMGDYAVLMVKFGIRDTSVTGMQLIPRVTLLSTGFFNETESYTANLSRLWPATDWELHMRATSIGSTDDSPYAP